MTAERLASTGRSSLGSATRPRAAITAVIPISSGRPAATSVPNVMMRMISVTGRESSPAFLRSSVMTSLTALLALAPPNCSTSRSGCRPGRRRPRRGWDRPGPWPRSNRRAISKSTRAAWPSAETSLSPVSGDFTFSTYWDLREAARHVLDRGPELRVLDGELVALDEHDLLDRPQAGAVERHLGLWDSPEN